MGHLASVRKVLSADFSSVPLPEKEETARHLVEVCSFACAGLVLQPVPLLEQAILPIQAGMVIAIAHVYGQELSRKRAVEILMDIAAVTGVSVIGRQALTTIAKIVLPGLGGILSAPYAFSVTWGTGFAAIHWLRAGGKPDAEKIRKIFEEERARSKERWSPEEARANRPDDADLADD